MKKVKVELSWGSSISSNHASLQAKNDKEVVFRAFRKDVRDALKSDRESAMEAVRSKKHCSGRKYHNVRDG